MNLWSKMLKDTKHKAKAAATLSDILCKNIATRFSDMHEDINRTSSKVSCLAATSFSCFVCFIYMDLTERTIVLSS